MTNIDNTLTLVKDAYDEIGPISNLKHCFVKIISKP